METTLASDVGLNAPTAADALPAPTLTLAEINTIDLIRFDVDRTGQAIATIQREGRGPDLDGLGHFMDIAEQSRGPWLGQASTEAQQGSQYWQQLLGQSSQLFGQRARAVAEAIQALDSLQGALPSLIDRLAAVLREHTTTDRSAGLPKMFRLE